MRTSSTIVNTTGTTSRLRIVDVIRPPTTTSPIGRRKLSSPCSPSTIGSMPAVIATVVMTIGRARLWQASIKARSEEHPSELQVTNAQLVCRLLLEQQNKNTTI